MFRSTVDDEEQTLRDLRRELSRRTAVEGRLREELRALQLRAEQHQDERSHWHKKKAAMYVMRTESSQEVAELVKVREEHARVKEDHSNLHKQASNLHSQLVTTHADFNSEFQVAQCECNQLRDELRTAQVQSLDLAAELERLKAQLLALEDSTSAWEAQVAQHLEEEDAWAKDQKESQQRLHLEFENAVSDIGGLRHRELTMAKAELVENAEVSMETIAQFERLQSHCKEQERMESELEDSCSAAKAEAANSAEEIKGLSAAIIAYQDLGGMATNSKALFNKVVELRSTVSEKDRQIAQLNAQVESFGTRNFLSGARERNKQNQLIEVE